EIDFFAAVRQRAALLEGASASVLDAAAERIRITPGAPALIATMRAHGAYTALVSGGFHCFTRRVKTALGFDCDVANEPLVANGKLTGKVGEPILGPETKPATLRRLAQERGLAIAETLAVGDGANDIGSVTLAGLGIGYHAMPALRAKAPHRIDHADLTALL